MDEKQHKAGTVSRRTVIGGLTATPALMISGKAAAQDRAPMLRHQVFFWLANPNSSEDRAKLIAGLETLRAIDVVRELHIGIPADTEARDVVDSSFSVSELMLFDDRDAQRAYQLDPVHQQFVTDCAHLWNRVIVYDSIDI